MEKGIVLNLDKMDKVKIEPVKIVDIYGTEIEINFSRSGLYRFDFINEDTWPTRDDGLGNKIPNCFSFSREEAQEIRNQLGRMLAKEAR